MVKLKDQEGYTLIESLVGIIIIGIVIVFFAVFFKQIFSNPKILLKSDAMILANQEIERCINYKISSDTSYLNNRQNLRIFRTITKSDKLNKVIVRVVTDSGRSEIISLSAKYLK